MRSLHPVTDREKESERDNDGEADGGSVGFQVVAEH